MHPSTIEQQVSHKLARAILAGFESMFAEFLNITLGAQSRFERAAWQEVQDAMRQRLQVYENKVELVCEAVKVIAYRELDHSDVWQRAKNDYAQLVEDHENALIAQTFFNSIHGSLLGQQKTRDIHRFILQEKYRPKPRPTDSILYQFAETDGIIESLRQVLNVFPLRIPFENLERDLNAARKVLAKITPELLARQNYTIEFGRSLFFRNKAAYIVGQMVDPESEECLPFAIALLNRKNSDGDICLYLDAFMIGEGQLSKLFGFARSYFMVDTHEFNYLVFDRQRFSPELLEEMTTEVADSITLSGNALILRHVYVERKVTPLNLYIKESSGPALEQVINDYGTTIKQLAAANIFPGDMLIKNFGVTRWGRVVFYDYDEICPLTSCHFRALPEPDNDIDALSVQPWFDIGENDVFPEQFPVFFAGHLQAKEHFDRLHQNLYGVDFWQKTQAAIKSGTLVDVYSYKEEWRLEYFYE